MVANLMGTIGILGLGYILGNSDDDAWWHFLALFIPGIFLHRLIGNAVQPGWVKKSGLILLALIFIALNTYSIYGFINNKSLIDGHRYEEMEGLMPFLICFISLIPAFMAIVLMLIPIKKSVANQPLTGST